MITARSPRGGAAHLVNFRGSDTVAGLVTARRFYDEPIAGFSIPAAEHSTITAWDEAHEVDPYRNMLKSFGADVAKELATRPVGAEGSAARLPAIRQSGDHGSKHVGKAVRKTLPDNDPWHIRCP